MRRPPGECAHAYLHGHCPYCVVEDLRRQVRWLEVQIAGLQLQYDEAVGELRRLEYKARERRARRYRETGQ